MSRADIADLLAANPDFRDPEAPRPPPGELDELAARLGAELPADYREFVLRGGLADLRFSHRILAPAEVVENLRHVEPQGLVPIADNGCGDLYCVARRTLPSDRLVLWDHETRSTSSAYGSLIEALRDWRF